jgi:hypothetical protein
MRVRRLVSAVLGGVALAGCAAVADLGNVALWDGGTGDAELDATTGGGDGSTGDAHLDGPTVPCTASCSPAVPQGWQGPLVLYEGANDGGAPPPCPSLHTGSGNQVFANLDGSVACSSCSCGSGAGAQCGAIQVKEFTTTTCTLPATCTTTVAAAGSCALACSAGEGHSITAMVADAGACPADGGIATTSFAFGTSAETCSAPAGTGTCAGGGACVTAAPAPFSSSTCVLASGDVPCPAGYPTQHVYYQGVDTSAAGCSPCTCSAPSVACSGAEITPEANDVCTAAVGPAEAVPTTCAGIVLEPAVAYLWVASTKLTPAVGPCSVEGGQPVGTAAPTGPVTVCCAP